mgnify:CR=1 FL=1
MSPSVFEIYHPLLTRARVDINENIYDEQDNLNKNFSFKLKLNSNRTRIAIWFWPWGIAPYFRINNHLINYGIMGIKQYDHQILFDIDENWLGLYRDNLIQSRINSLFQKKEFDQKLYESSIGYNVNHDELISKIKKKIDE